MTDVLCDDVYIFVVYIFVVCDFESSVCVIYHVYYYSTAYYISQMYIILFYIYTHICIHIARSRATEGEQGPQAELSRVRRTHIRCYQTWLEVRHDRIIHVYSCIVY